MQLSPMSPTTNEKNETVLQKYYEKLKGDDLQKFEATVDKFARWLVSYKAYYIQALPWILELTMAAYMNVVARVVGEPYQNGQAPINLSAFGTNPWALAYLKLPPVLAKNDAYFTDVSHRHTLGFIKDTMGPKDAAPNPHSSSSATVAPMRPKAKRLPPDLSAYIRMDLEAHKSNQSSLSARLETPELAHSSSTPEASRQRSTGPPRSSVEILMQRVPELQQPKVEEQRAFTLMQQPQSNNSTSPEPSQSQTGPMGTQAHVSLSTMPPTSTHSNPNEPIADTNMVEPIKFRSEPQSSTESSVRNPGLPLGTAVIIGIPAPVENPISTRTIQISATEYASLQRWQTRFMYPQALDTCECFSLCAYQLDNARAIDAKEIYTLDTFWPHDNNLRFRTTHSPDWISLTDPSLLSHSLADLAPFLREGVNEVEVTQDSSGPGDYCLFLMKHAPTDRQLQEVLAALGQGPPVENGEEPQDMNIDCAARSSAIPEEVRTSGGMGISAKLSQEPFGLQPAPETSEPPVSSKEIRLPESETLEGTTLLLSQQVNGTYSHPQTTQFDISPNVFDNVQRWQARYKDVDNVEGSTVISVACYKSEEIINEQDFTKLMPSWPSRGNLRMQAPDGCSLKLSPPSYPDSKMFVDLSSYVSVGQNQLVLSADEPMFAYVIVVLAHRPTRGQLEPVVNRRQKDQQWNTFLRDLAKPIELPPLVWRWEPIPEPTIA